MSNSLCSSIAVGVVTGLISSAIVAVLFYWRGRIDTEAVHRKLQLDEVLMRIKMLDPSRRHSVRGQDGVDDTCHWLICKAEIMRSAGFTAGADALEKLEKEIQQCPREPAAEPPVPTDESRGNETKKRAWEKTIQAVPCGRVTSFHHQA